MGYILQHIYKDPDYILEYFVVRVSFSVDANIDKYCNKKWKQNNFS